MDEKRPFQRAMSPPRSMRRSRPALSIAFIIAIVYTFWLWQPFQPTLNEPIVDIASDDAQTTDRLVPLEAHIMSKCPDAKDALEQLVLPVMQRVHDKVNFTLSYIGRPTANDGVDCMHGPSECMGNIIELCARELYPDPKINLGFIMCLSRDYQEIPERSLVEDCALESAIDFQQLNDCTVKEDGAWGLSLLRNSIKRTADVWQNYRSPVNNTHANITTRPA
ncbi:gamma interferon inducible lysosomal thiol reductase [Fusarium heterosporum]|uniref:Gamma interferon inducible lysosomal thiol reductase n=1 Tax=Fusarium heterosporum TaxID=42747 RepID=A0A8H5TEL5_FUSHE|nr:gamma interferon inducible lysosomal thiol reductase [Fusarium heterosporum]